MTLGDKLSKLRKENNYTQEQLADILGVSRQAISKWESNTAYPETDKMIRISRLFNCSLDYLFKEEIEADRNIQPDGAASYSSGSRREKKSARTLWGLPLWHVGRNAKGVVAIGMNAKGIIAIGLKAKGVIALGLLSFGVISLGLVSLGFISLALVSLGVISCGTFAAGIFAAGAISLGVISTGAIAVGEFSVGALAVGKYFALGDNARAMVAIGIADTSEVSGSVFQKIGDMTSQDYAAVKEALDSVVPGWLSWAKEIVKFFMP